MASHTRLRAIRRHVAPAAAERPYAELGPASSEPPKLLTDAQMHEFIGQGFLTLGLDDLGAEFHAHLYARAKEEFGPVNNGLRGTGGSTERIPELLTMVDSPVVAGAPWRARCPPPREELLERCSSWTAADLRSHQALGLRDLHMEMANCKPSRP